MANKLWVGTDTGNEGDWGTAANWSPAGVPVNADNVYLTNSSQSVTGTLDQSAVALASLNIDQSYTGTIGTDAAYLQIGTAILNIGYHHGPGTPAGSGKMKIDLGSVTACTAVVENTGTPTDTYKDALRLLAANAATTLEVRKGKVGVANDAPGETSTLSAIAVGYLTQKKTDSYVNIGDGVTLTTFKQTGGTNLLKCAATTVTGWGGKLETFGTGAITTLNAYGADIVPNSTGTITTLDGDAGSCDFLQSAQARTVTTLKQDGTFVLKYDSNIVTVTNKVDSDDPVVLTASVP